MDSVCVMHRETGPERVLTLKTAFLVAIILVRWVSELLALSLAMELCTIQEDRITLNTDPSLLPKVNSSFHRPQSIVLLSQSCTP